MYREVKGQAYTRKEYMVGIPAARIVRFDDGDTSQKFSLKLTLLAQERCQIRHNALEAARIAATKYIASKAGTNYYLKIRIYPHHILRENKQAVGAGADRISQGMRASFGTPVGSSARVQKNQKLITISTQKRYLEDAKEALRRAKMKLPTPCKVIIEET
jgi:large subunit ribosomal protein L10e